MSLTCWTGTSCPYCSWEPVFTEWSYSLPESTCRYKGIFKVACSKRNSRQHPWVILRAISWGNEICKPVFFWIFFLRLFWRSRFHFAVWLGCLDLSVPLPSFLNPGITGVCLHNWFTNELTLGCELPFPICRPHPEDSHKEVGTEILSSDLKLTTFSFPFGLWTTSSVLLSC